jgi:hypothetical protein
MQTQTLQNMEALQIFEPQQNVTGTQIMHKHSDLQLQTMML